MPCALPRLGEQMIMAPAALREFKAGTHVRILYTNELATVVCHPNPPVGVVYVRCDRTNNVCDFHGQGVLNPDAYALNPTLPRFGWTPWPEPAMCQHSPDGLERI